MLAVGDAVWTGLFALLSTISIAGFAYLTSRLKSAVVAVADKAVKAVEDVAAKRVEEVTEVIKEATNDKSEQLNRIETTAKQSHDFANSEMLEMKRKYKVKCDRAAAEKPCKANIEEAKEATDRYEAHLKTTKEMAAKANP